jgi:hypothetical protein
MFWFLVATGLAISHAAAPTELVVIGLHVGRLSTQDSIETTERITQAAGDVSGFQLVDPDEVRSRLRGRGSRISNEALQAHGQAMLSEGRVLFEHADLESAQERILESVEALEHALAGATDSKALVDALLAQGNLGLSMGDIGLAQASFKRVIQLDASRELDPVYYPPKVVQLFDSVRSQVLAVPVGSIAVDFQDPSAEVYVDGRYRGEGPQTIQDMVPGVHRILVATAGGRRSHGKVEVYPGEKTQISLSIDSYFVGLAGENSDEWARQTGDLYAAIGDQVTDGMVLIAGETKRGELAVQLYESRTGNFSRILYADSSVELERRDLAKTFVGLTGQLGTFLSDSGTLAPEQVSPNRLDVDISTNPVLAAVLFGSVAPVTAGPMTPTSPAPAVAGEQKMIPWYIWAGVGVMVASATGVALALQPEPTSNSGNKKTETGTVVVRF